MDALPIDAVCGMESQEIEILVGLASENVVYLKEYFQEGNKVRFCLPCGFAHSLLDAVAFSNGLQEGESKRHHQGFPSIAWHCFMCCCFQQSHFCCDIQPVLLLQPSLADPQRV